MSEPALTPMMRQWSELKAIAKDALLFFRLGDFYELFENDAVTAAPILQIALTSRNTKSSTTPSSPLCGIPVAHFEGYLQKALDAGFKVALAEQTEEPGAGKTIVRREIVQWFTPGIRFLKNESRSHYIGVVSIEKQNWILAAADVGTGHTSFETGEGLDALQEIIDRMPIEDLRIRQSTEASKIDLRVKYKEFIDLETSYDSERTIRESFGIDDLRDALVSTKLEVQVFGSLLNILKKAHPRDRLRFLLPRISPDTVWISSATRKNLYLFEPEGRCIFDLLNKTQTALGRRELKQTLSHPTQNLDVLRSRQTLVRYFRNHSNARKGLRQKLFEIHDIHRLLRRLKGPRELVQIQQSLEAGIASIEFLEFQHEIVDLFRNSLETCRPLLETLSNRLQISEDPEWGWIQNGVNAELDDLRGLKQNADRLLSELEETLRTETKVNSLKIKFHQVFGYVAEVSANHRDKIPAHAKRIQTLANAERFKTDALVQLEEKLLSLESRIKEAETSEINRLLVYAFEFERNLLQWADSLASLDCFQALAEVSQNLGWTTPRISPRSGVLKIKQASHPLATNSFIPLSFELDSKTQQVMLLTGPNMAGKSTVLRMAALTALLHQIGSDIPAESAELSLFDRIGCRMGATDDITTGQSTFFVEMREVASMLRGATTKSLLVFDEIGRGTSTYDGMSLAWAITEEVHELGALSLIATHYLELADLERLLDRLRSFHLGVEDINGRLIFTRDLRPGPASRSYGIHVAKLADISSGILERAQQKLNEFEKRRAKPMPLFEMMQRQNT